GGSSSGTGVAVAAGLVPAGIGSDTGGSVRVPAAFNGVVGLKTTFGLISLKDTGLLSWSLDTIGPLARSVDDCAALLRVLADTPPELPAPLAAGRLERYRIALPDRAQLPPFMHPAVLEAWVGAARRLEQLGARVVPARLPAWYFELARDVGMILASEAFELHRAHIEDRDQAINDAVRERILNAKQLAPGEYAGMLRTMQERRRAFGEWFRDYDALLLPTVPVPAPPLDELDERAPIPSYLTRSVNYLGLCALALPAGLHEGLPLGVQVVGKPFAEREILEIGKAWQEDTGHHKLRPKLG
ncbi:MAG: amidase, partial [Betaproteobacteria bacterium]|nr:amidase [Betaproteobacteria bacterium]